MLGRTVSLWRRLTGGEAPPEQDAVGLAVEEDRRVWVRHPADVEATCQPAGGAADRFAARVRNVSLGGINLVADRAFEPGALLSIELPGAADGSTCTVLACVVHATALSGGEWALGCTFSRELSDEDLQAFGARRVKAPPADQRTWQRFHTNVTARYQTVTAPDAEACPAQVLNISASGVGLLVTKAIAPGILLNVELHSADGAARRTMLACVVHVTARNNAEWAVGCNFIRSLSEEDLEALL